MNRRSFLGLLGATALTPFVPAPAAVKELAHEQHLEMGAVYARQLAIAMCETQEIVAAHVMDRAFNEIWFQYPDRSAVFEWIDKGAVTEPDYEYECVGHGDYRPVRYKSTGVTFNADYARSLFP